jgi:hypothetical protein
VKFVQNFTDIDDKLIARAQRLGTTVKELAEKHSNDFLADMAKLNVRPADIFVRATDTIDKIIEVTAGLVEDDVRHRVPDVTLVVRGNAADVHLDRIADRLKLLFLAGHRVVDAHSVRVPHKLVNGDQPDCRREQEAARAPGETSSRSAAAKRESPWSAPSRWRLAANWASSAASRCSSFI